MIKTIHENYGYIERLNHFMDNLSRTSFRDTKFLKVIEVTDKYITVEKDQFTKKSVKRDDFRIVKINGRYHACELFDRVVK
ncbi:hypothetical protein [Lactococcus lactis]|uniref:hypothetical protein n=1 Tax=Lactococcus lactis TaxID=1358 RepID=UPI00288DFCCD|nr:hypothetical protein [Lactococcus lactis]MDT2967957.1 hypothetical protein [Lactococcus lactis]